MPARVVGCGVCRRRWPRGACARPGRCTGPVRFDRVPVPEPGVDEVLVRVLACGVCRTDLHVAEGDLPRAPARRGPRPRGRRRGRGRRFRGADRSQSATGSASRGCATPVVSCVYCRRGPRTSARTRGTPAGTPTADTPSSPSRPRRTCYRAAGRLPGRASSRRCCVRESSATGRCARADLPDGRAARHLRVRRQRPSHRAGRAARGAPGARDDPRRAARGSWHVSSALRPAGRGRPAAGATGLGHHVRTGRRAGAARAGGAGPGRHAGASPASTCPTSRR